METQQGKDFWKGIEELRKQMKETDRRMKETDRQMKETSSFLREHLDRISSKLEGIGMSNGIVAESFFIEATEKGIEVGGIKFKQTAVNFIVQDGFNHKAEIDLVFNNSKYILLVEIKYRLDKQQIHTFNNIIHAMKEYCPELVKDKEILTAFASLGVKESIKKEFIKAGHYIFTQDQNEVKVDGKHLKALKK